MAETKLQSAALADENDLLIAVYNAVLDALAGGHAFTIVCSEVMAAHRDYKPASGPVRIPKSELEERQ